MINTLSSSGNVTITFSPSAVNAIPCGSDSKFMLFFTSSLSMKKSFAGLIAPTIILSSLSDTIIKGSASILMLFTTSNSLKSTMDIDCDSVFVTATESDNNAT